MMKQIKITSDSVHGRHGFLQYTRIKLSRKYYPHCHIYLISEDVYVKTPPLGCGISPRIATDGEDETKDDINKLVQEREGIRNNGHHHML